LRSDQITNRTGLVPPDRNLAAATLPIGEESAHPRWAYRRADGALAARLERTGRRR